jgi:hypothetical protein
LSHFGISATWHHPGRGLVGRRVFVDAANVLILR